MKRQDDYPCRILWVIQFEININNNISSIKCFVYNWNSYGSENFFSFHLAQATLRVHNTYTETTKYFCLDSAVSGNGQIDLCWYMTCNFFTHDKTSLRKKLRYIYERLKHISTINNHIYSLFLAFGTKRGSRRKTIASHLIYYTPSQ